jgi:hypothetical protein
MLRPVVNRHRNRQNAMGSLRQQLTAQDDQRTHDNFTKKLSGYATNGTESGPYGGVRLVDARRHQANGDTRHLGTSGGSDFAGNFAKGLEHAPLNQGGLVNANDYRDFANAHKSIAAGARATPIGDENALDAIDGLNRPAASDGSRRPYTNALSGAGAITNTLDSMAITIPPAPEFDGAFMAGEMAELYWMAAVRDVRFANWNTDPNIAAAITHLDTLNAAVGFTEHHTSASRTNPNWSRTVDATTLFRGSAYGVNKGPYVSQFLLRSFRFGTLVVDQVYRATNENMDFMTTEDAWLAVQRLGSKDGKAPLAPSGYEQPINRHLATLRDLAHYVHFDALHEAYFNAALILADIKAPLNPANPYVLEIGTPPKARNLFTQEGFGTFGGPSALVILSEVATRALKTVWHQKWFVHRRLRPEAMGGRIHAANQHGFTDLVHASLLQAQGNRAAGAAFPAVAAAAKDGTFLLPMAFEEGSPMHPAYGAGHATVAGACVTILKAMFEPEAPLRALFNARVAPGDSTIDTIGDLVDTDASGNLQTYAGADLTVEGELNKLAANIAIARNAAGVHYRSDYTKSLALGEAVAVGLLQELAFQVVEADPDRPVWTLPTFAGHWITIDAAGTVERVGNRPTNLPPPRQAASFNFAA